MSLHICKNPLNNTKISISRYCTYIIFLNNRGIEMFSLRQHRIKVILGTAKCVCCCSGTNNCMCIDISYLRTLPSAITVDATAFVFNKDALSDITLFGTLSGLRLLVCVRVRVFVCVGAQYTAHTPYNYEVKRLCKKTFCIAIHLHVYNI